MNALKPLSLLFTLLAFSLGLFGCASSPDTKSPATTEMPAPDLNYAVQPGDILTISVWKEKDLDRDVVVTPDGGISFPLAGDIEANGKTIEQLKKEITARLSKYIPGASVTVAAKQIQGNKVYVVGKVNRPGEFVAARNVDVMQALAMAGGVTPFASVNNIKILRRVNGVQTALPFKYSQVESGRNLKDNVVLQAGDIVVVP